MPSQLPVAKPVKPLFSIDGKIHLRIPHSEGLTNADAIRGKIPILSGPDKGGFKVGWFVLLSDTELLIEKLQMMTRYASYCNCCAKSGENNPQDYDAFVAEHKRLNQ